MRRHDPGVALIAGPLAWALRQLVSYALVRPSCAVGSAKWLLLIAAAMLLLTLSGAAAGRVCLVRSGARGGDAGSAGERAWFMATVAVGLDLLIALLIVVSVVSELVLSPCE